MFYKNKERLNDMNKINKNFSVFLIAIILVGLGFTKNVYAEWEHENCEWKYLGDYGYEKAWQQINGKWYYLDSETGIMKIGWFYDEQYNKWYYLNFYGDMDASKTTCTYPTELSNIENKIKQITNEDVIYKWTKDIDDNMFVCFMGKNEIQPKQYYYHQSTGNIYEIKNGILTNIETKETVDFFTEEQAVQVVKDYFSKSYKDIPQVIKVESNQEEYYLIHCYDDKEGYETNSSWYHVNKTTRDVTSII